MQYMVRMVLLVCVMTPHLPVSSHKAKRTHGQRGMDSVDIFLLRIQMSAPLPVTAQTVVTKIDLNHPQPEDSNTPLRPLPTPPPDQEAKPPPPDSNTVAPPPSPLPLPPTPPPAEIKNSETSTKPSQTVASSVTGPSSSSLSTDRGHAVSDHIIDHAHGHNKICSLPADTGPCRAFIPKYFYDATAGECQSFIFGGCGGNDNKFSSEDECRKVCSP